MSAWLQAPAYARLWQACRGAWERNGGLAGKARVNGLSNEEAAALDALLVPLRRRGAAPLRAGDNVHVELVRLNALLVDGPGVSLSDVLTTHGGPLRNLPAQRSAQRDSLAQMWADAHAHPAAADDRVDAWLRAARRAGTVTRAAKQSDERRRLLLVTLDVLATLPRDGVELSRLASEVTGDTHALDYGVPLGRLCSSAVAAVFGMPRAQNAAQWRVVWSRAGVACDALSATVLTLGLRPLGPGAVASAARVMAEAGQPHVLTLHAMLTERPAFEPQMVFVCENPALVAFAAARLRGSSHAPLVCTGGWPSTAVSRLLRALRQSGCTLRMQGDFDWEGARIHRHVGHAHSAANWRFTADVYRQAVAARRGSDVVALSQGELGDTSALSTLMRRTRVAVYEEDLAELLCAELIGPLGTLEHEPVSVPAA